MSYILDALRKAERDRNLGRTPSLGDVTAPADRPPARAPSRRVLALLGLVAGLLVLTLLVWPRQPDRSRVPLVEAQPARPVPVGDQGRADAPPAEEPDRAEAASTQPADPALDEEVAAESIDDLLEPPASAPAFAAESEPEPEPEADPDPAQATADPATPVTESLPAGADVPEDAASDAEPAVGRYTLLRDMPTDYRAGFPELRIDVHVHDDDPARRWALINGRRVVEGATLSEGPRVVEINAEGIAFDFKGRTALIPLRR